MPLAAKSAALDGSRASPINSLAGLSFSKCRSVFFPMSPLAPVTRIFPILPTLLLAPGRISESYGSDVETRGRDAKISVFRYGSRQASTGFLPVIQGLYPHCQHKSLHPLTL